MSEWAAQHIADAINNHKENCPFVLGRKWHLYDITSFEGIHAMEKYFVHGAGESILTPFEEADDLLTEEHLPWHLV